MHKRLFVTGTDTDVGKTIVSRALMQAISAQGKSVAGYKPVANRCLVMEEGIRNKDAFVLQQSSTFPLTYDQVNPISTLSHVFYIDPYQTINYTAISEGLEALEKRADCVVVEGSDGWKVLMSDLRPFSDWVVQEQIPVVLVVGIKLGCISHALLTAQSILNDGLKLVGWVANRINPGHPHYAETIELLKQKISAPLLGEIPYLPRPEERDLSRYIDISKIAK